MKKILFCAAIVLGSLFSAKAQNIFGDPYIDISMNPPTVGLNQTGSLEVLTGNAGFTDICINSMIITISVGLNAEILGIAPTGQFGPSDPRWTQAFLSAGAGNTIQLVNTNGFFTGGDLNYVYLTVKGVALGGPLNIGGFIAYIIGQNPACNGNQPYPGQGNLVLGNDNGTTSLIVSIITPLHFTGSAAKANGCSGLISWSTADEQNVKTFEVQQSFDGNNFSTVKTITSMGAGSHDYSVEVNQPQKRMFYRVLATDIDGRKSYGAYMSLQLTNCTKAAIVQVYPIPAYRDQKVTMQANVNDKITYRVIDISGKVVETGQFVRTKQLEIKTGGTYLLEMTSAGFKETQTIIIQ